MGGGIFTENNINEDKYFISLKNRIWKLLPIYEGKGINKEIIYSKDDAFGKYQLYLSRILTELDGAKNINKSNTRYAELYYLLEGMKNFTLDDHKKVRDIVLHCCGLCEKLEEV